MFMSALNHFLEHLNPLPSHAVLQYDKINYIQRIVTGPAYLILIFFKV